MAEPRPITRDVLAKFLPDPESVRRFEKLFYVVSELTPAEIAALRVLVQEASVDASTAQSTAQSALDQLAQIIQDAAINAGEADGKAMLALDTLGRIAQSLEMLALSPVASHGILPEDTSPPRSPVKVDELADAAVSTPVAGELLIYDATLKRWENHLLTAGTNVTIVNADGSITLSVAGAAPSGAAGGVLSGTYPNPGLAASPTLVTPKATTTIGVGNATPAASGAGITFPATQSASTDANTLDDYEEGSWTPIDSSGAGLSISGAGTYVKIGRVVYFQSVIVYPVTANAATALIGGLPFVATGGSGSQGRSGLTVSASTAALVGGLYTGDTTTFYVHTAGLTKATNANLTGAVLYVAGLFFN